MKYKFPKKRAKSTIEKPPNKAWLSKLLFLCFWLFTSQIKAQNIEYLLGEVEVIINKDTFDLYQIDPTISKEWLEEKIDKNIDKSNTSLFGWYLYVSLFQSADNQPYETIKKWFKEGSWQANSFSIVFGERAKLELASYYENYNDFLKNIGEKPTYFDSDRVEKTKKRLAQLFRQLGYFEVKIVSGFRKKGENINITYEIETAERYKISWVDFQTKDEKVQEIIDQIDLESRIDSGDYFLENKIVQMTDYLIEEGRNKGLFDWYKNLIQVELDTIRASKKVGVRFRLNSNVQEQKMEQYRVKEIKVFPNYNFKTPQDQLKKETYKGVTFWTDSNSNISLPILWEAIAQEKDSLFSQVDRNMTIQNLHQMGVYKKIDFGFRKQMGTDSIPSLKAMMYLPQQQKYGVGFNFDGSYSNNYSRINAGTNFSVNNLFGYNDKNFINFHYATESFDINQDAQPVSTNSFGVSVKTQLPFNIFVSPTKYKERMPRTNINLGYNQSSQLGILQDNLKANINIDNWIGKNTSFRFDFLKFELNANKDKSESLFRSLLLYYTDLRDSLYVPNEDKTVYSLNETKKKEWENTVLPVESAQSQRELILGKQQRLDLLLQENVILAMKLGLTQTSSNGDLFFQTNLEVSGLILSLLNTWLPSNSDGNRVILDIPYAQYTKLEFDFRRYINLWKNTKLAYRTFIGIAYAYGNSDRIPFQKRYFAGGTNDVRAWNTYDLGLGGEQRSKVSQFNLITGSMKLLANVEYRFQIYKKLEGAFFVDAGNIWDIDRANEDKLTQFQLDKLKDEIAIGIGTGLRLALGPILLRMDLAAKAYDPSVNQGDWVLKDFKSLNDITFNFGLGYPF